jgi:hypothetical protein
VLVRSAQPGVYFLPPSMGNLFLNMVANVVKAMMVSSPIVSKGTLGCGCFRASVMSWAAIKTLSVDESCGMGEL